MSRLVMAIDQGTTGTTVVVADEEFNIRARVNREFEQIYPRPGWVEHDPEAIWQSVLGAVRGAMDQAKESPDRIAAIGITNQRETTMIWERATGRPVHNAIVWQCRRTADLCDAIRRAGSESEVRRRTGLVVDPYFSATKIRWLMDHVEGLRKRATAGELAFGTVDTFLTWRLTGGAAHVTDASNASRTALFNIHEMKWDPELLRIFDVPADVLPEVRPSSEVYGATAGVEVLPDAIPVAGMAGDQQAALFGQACFEPGQAKCTYGTGSFLMMNVGPRPVLSDQGLLGTVAWQLGERVTYALEGAVFIAGAAVQWLRDGLRIIESAPEVEALARQVPDSGGVVFVPALAGLGAPHWRPEARGLICGVTRGTTRAHLARATLEGIALSVHEVLDLMQREAGRRMDGLRVDGGAAANDLLMQLQADLLRAPISRPEVLETTALGSALLAGLAVGVWKDLDEIAARWREQKKFEPAMEEGALEEMLERWRTAMAKV